MKLYKQTSKLFFDKYVNKISVVNVFASEFRSRSIARAMASIKILSNQIEASQEGRVQLRSWRKKYATVSDVIYINKLVDILNKETDFLLRVEGDTLNIYTNSDTLLDAVQLLGSIREITKPANDKVRAFLLTNPNSIISKKYTHKYRITVNPLRDSSESFHAWAEQIPSIKLLKRTYHSEGYFYAANQKTLGMCRLFLGSKIRRVDEMYLISEI